MAVLLTIPCGVPSSGTACPFSLAVMGGICNRNLAFKNGRDPMPIIFSPTLGTVLMCDFTGFKPPEMTKVRPVVVVSPRRRRHGGSCMVVPFSTVAPRPVEKHHLCIPANAYPFFKPDTEVWAKGDMVCHVSFERLDRIFYDGKYSSPSLNLEDLRRIKCLVWEAMGCPVLENQAQAADKKGMEDGSGGKAKARPAGILLLKSTTVV